MRISQLSCDAKDFVLAGSFEWRELANLLSSAGKPIDESAAGPVPPADLALQVAHRLCHEAGPFATRLELVLDCIHAETVERVRRADPKVVAAWCHHGALDPSGTLGGWVWAIATDPRDEVRRSLPVLLMRIRFQSFRRFQEGAKAG